MNRVNSEDIGAFYQRVCRIPVILTARSQGKDNAMTVTRHCLISIGPPLYGVAVAPDRYSYQLITESKRFGINLLPFATAKLIASVGSISGAEIDKFHKFNIAVDKSIEAAVPILKDAYAACECQLVDDRAYGDRQLLVGEIVAVHLLKEVLTSKGVLDLDKVSPVLFLGRGHYVTASKETAIYTQADFG